MWTKNLMEAKLMNHVQFDALQANTLDANPNTINHFQNPLEIKSNINESGSAIDKGIQDNIDAWLQSDRNAMGDSQNNQIDGHKSLDNFLSCGGDKLQDSNANTKDPLVGGQQTLVNSSDTDALMKETKPVSLASPASPSTDSGTKYYVSPDGSDDNPGTVDKPWKTVNFATSEGSPVKAGDTILVQPGTYTELVNLEKSGDSNSGHITLKANGDVTLRDPDNLAGGFREGVIQSAGQGYWNIDGFRIENSSWAGIALRDANNMIVQNNHTFETGASGIIVMPDQYYDGGDKEVTSKDIKVLNNTIERANWRWQGGTDENGTQEALSIWGVDGFEVANNTVKEGKREGIDAKTGSRNGSIHDNFVTKTALLSGTPGGYNGGSAIYVDGGRADQFNIDVYNNVVSGNTADAISIADEVPNMGNVSDIRVYNNVVNDNGIQGTNGGRGVYIGSNVKDVEVVNNTFDKNVQAIEIDGSDYLGGAKTDNVMVRNNIFADSTYRNGALEDVSNLTMDNNLFTNQFEQLYEGGTGLDNLKADNNDLVESVGFVNPDSNDFRLSSNSSAIDAGSSDIAEYAKVDMEGVTRAQGQGVDAGAYELKA
jgi:hypothetical protein